MARLSKGKTGWSEGVTSGIDRKHCAPEPGNINLALFASGGRRVRQQSVIRPQRSAARSHPASMDAGTPE